MIFLIGATLPVFDLWRWWAFHEREHEGTYEPRPDWSAPYGGGIDFSCYAYRDRNRDGRLDLGDEPMAGVAVEMTGPNGKTIVRRSNLGGFVNFPMSLSQRKALIRAPGTYSFRAVAPAGWAVTSGNTSQSTTFEKRPGAPADMIASDPTLPVGLAPDLVILGRVVTRGDGGAFGPAANVALRAIGPHGDAIAVSLSGDSRFRIPAAPGRWRLMAEEKSTGARVEREVNVLDAPVRVSAMVLGEHGADAFPPAPGRGTVDFESVTGAPVAKVPSGVAGVDWFYLNAIDAVFANGDGYVNTLVSGRYVAYSSSGHPVTISRPGGFDFAGAYFGVALPQAEGETLRVQAFRAGREVGADDVPLSVFGPVWFDADYRGVDRVVLTTLHYWQFVTDDMVIGAPGATAGDPPRTSAAPAAVAGR